MNETKEDTLHSFLYTDNVWLQFGVSGAIVAILFCVGAFLQKESPKIITPHR